MLNQPVLPKAGFLRRSYAVIILSFICLVSSIAYLIGILYLGFASYPFLGGRPDLDMPVWFFFIIFFLASFVLAINIAALIKAIREKRGILQSYVSALRKPWFILFISLGSGIFLSCFPILIVVFGLNFINFLVEIF